MKLYSISPIYSARQIHRYQLDASDGGHTFDSKAKPPNHKPVSHGVRVTSLLHSHRRPRSTLRATSHRLLSLPSPVPPLQRPLPLLLGRTRGGGASEPLALSPVDIENQPQVS